MKQERSILRIDLPRLITVQVAGFVLYHLNQEIIFNAAFQRATLGEVWIGNAVATFGSWTWLFGPGIIILWWTYKGACNRPLALGLAGLTFYCAYYLQYPVLTSLLYQLGQIERFPLWMMDNAPQLSDIFGI